MPKKIMILGASVLQLPAIVKAKEMGLDVVVVDMNPKAVGFKEPCIEKEIISTIDIPAVLEAAKRHRINGIMTLASDMPMRTVASVAKELNLIGIDENTAIKATNKFEMRKALQQANVPIPLFFRASTFSEYKKIINSFNGKFITKPADNSGSRGIFLVDNISKAEEAYFYSKLNSRNGDIVIEEYMEGPEVSVETISIDGKCQVIQITDKLTTGAPHFVEMGHSQPSALSEDIKEKIKSVSIKANNAIGIFNGPSHTEIIVTKNGPKIVEIGARLGGDCITTHLVPLSTGIDMVKICIMIALGEKPVLTKPLNKGSAIRYFNQKSGIVRSIKGLEEAKAIEGVREVKCLCNIGDTITSIDNSSNRICFVIAEGHSSADAINSCETAIKHIHIETDSQIKRGVKGEKE